MESQASQTKKGEPDVPEGLAGSGDAAWDWTMMSHPHLLYASDTTRLDAAATTIQVGRYYTNGLLAFYPFKGLAMVVRVA